MERPRTSSDGGVPACLEMSNILLRVFAAVTTTLPHGGVHGNLSPSPSVLAASRLAGRSGPRECSPLR